MGPGNDSRAGAAGERRSGRAALYQIIMNGAIERGEIARIEIEIQKLFPPPFPEPRCPCWHTTSPVNWPASGLH